MEKQNRQMNQKMQKIGTFIKDMENGRSCEIQMKLLIYRSDDQAIEDFEN